MSEMSSPVEQMFGSIVPGETVMAGGMEERVLVRVEDFSRLFAQWFVIGEHLVVHLFPRDGQADLWEDGHYIPRCERCDTEIRGVPRGKVHPKSFPPCPRCSASRPHVEGGVAAHLKYVPGRVETGTKLRFPQDMPARIKLGVDSVWGGDFAMVFEEGRGTFFDQNGVSVPSPAGIHGLGMYSVQFQGASENEDLPLLVDKFCEVVDSALERSK